MSTESRPLQFLFYLINSVATANAPTLIGLIGGPPGSDIGHGVNINGLTYKEKTGATTGFYFMDSQWWQIRWVRKDVLSGWLYNYDGVMVQNTWGNPKLVAEGDSENLPFKTAALTSNRPVGLFRPRIDGGKSDGGGDSIIIPYSNPIESVATFGVFEARADGVVGPQGLYSYLYDPYFSNLKFMDMYPVYSVSSTDSADIACTYIRTYLLAVGDGTTGEQRGAIVVQESRDSCSVPPNPMGVTEFGINFPASAVTKKVSASGATAPQALMPWDVKKMFPGCTIRAVMGTNRLGYVGYLHPFNEVRDANGALLKTISPHGEEIVWNGTEYVLAGNTASAVQLPTELAAFAAPNPFNPVTSISFALPKSGPVTIEVFNVLGQRVRTLADQAEYQTGRHSVIFDGRDNSGIMLPSGVYFYKIVTREARLSGKMVFLK